MLEGTFTVDTATKQVRSILYFTYPYWFCYVSRVRDYNKGTYSISYLSYEECFIVRLACPPCQIYDRYDWIGNFAAETPTSLNRLRVYGETSEAMIDTDV